MNKNVRFIVFALALIALTAAACSATQYSGTLTWSNSQIITGGNWSNAATSLAWTVTDLGSLWEYHYTFTTTKPGTSHLIIETSQNLTENDIILNSLSGDLNYSGPDWWDNSQGNSNPGIPENIFGIKIAPPSSSTTVNQQTTWDMIFLANRRPVWGDFYAKGGNDSYAYNAGYTNAFLSDNYVTADNLNLHLTQLAVPDTIPTVTVPEPCSMILGAIGLVTTGCLRRRITRK